MNSTFWLSPAWFLSDQEIAFGPSLRLSKIGFNSGMKSFEFDHPLNSRPQSNRYPLHSAKHPAETSATAWFSNHDNNIYIYLSCLPATSMHQRINPFANLPISIHRNPSPSAFLRGLSYHAVSLAFTISPHMFANKLFVLQFKHPLPHFLYVAQR